MSERKKIVDRGSVSACRDSGSSCCTSRTRTIVKSSAGGGSRILGVRHAVIGLASGGEPACCGGWEAVETQ